MKRIKAACIQQVLHFQLKEDLEPTYAQAMVEAEVKRYKDQLNISHTQYKILSEEKQEDGSVMIEIIKQYNTAPVGKYLD
jgi:hypothetical protein